ncbi:N-acetyltransferase B complex non catalytic subunit-domain-containing protein [Cytidiella melzeri]|nr:N-acetyltransferase B complex non catalytic subunit-domain-containing protein [Cytidiella melzeri]
MSVAFDRQIRQIYDAIDTGSNKSAIVACNKLLKKQPNHDLVKALKALALIRSQKVEESLVICDEVLAAKPFDEAVLNAMSHVLRGLGRHLDIISMYEVAWKQQPTNEELGINVFSANTRAANWKAAQQVATKLHKQFKEERFLYWSIFCAVLQANDPLTPEGLRPVLFKLAHRLIASSSTPSYFSADRFYVNLVILKELELWDDASTLLSSEIGQAISNTSLSVDELRRDIWKLKGSVKEEGERAKARILEKNDRNWLEFISVLDATFWGLSSEVKEAAEECQSSLSKSQQFFAQIADKDGIRDRSAPLALLELEKRAISHGLSADPDALYTLVESYFENFGDKSCCYEDLLSYVTLFKAVDSAKWNLYLQHHASTSSDSQHALSRSINAFKLLRSSIPTSSLTVDSETALAKQYIEAYFDAVKFGKGLPETERQPADDFAILAGQTFVSLWKLVGRDEGLKYLFTAAALLDFAVSKSKDSYHIKLMLIRIYLLIGAPSLALEQYRALNLKQIQTDTLSHLVLSRASAFALSALGDLTYSTECMEASQIYLNNANDTSEFVVRAFMQEKYTQIPEFAALEDRLENSLQRDLMKVEHVRMRLSHETINTELVDMELIELKFIFDRLHHDNRDFDIIPNLQPVDGPSFEEQTRLFGKTPHQGWLSAFLKIYIRAFQQASDLDDTVEDKLLIGDRPKPHIGAANKGPVRRRVAERVQDEIDELTSDEVRLFEFTTALGDWLEPHHDHIRPPPSTVMSEVARLSELKTGQQLKGFPAPTPENGQNGEAKKDEEPPAVREPSGAVTQFFSGMKEHFDASLGNSVLPPELLHIVALTQEAFLIFTVVVARFKPSGVIKAHKLSQLVQHFKDIRTSAAEALNHMSAELRQLAEAEEGSTARTTFADACKMIEGSAELDHEYIVGIAKKVTDARKAIFEGISNGSAKIAKTHV